ncbi:unnamed protein product, partial [Mesorhabditis spiculigera]
MKRIRIALSKSDPRILEEIDGGQRSISFQGQSTGEVNSEQRLHPLRAGTRTVIGGKAYIAVPIDGVNGVGPVHWEESTQTIPSTTIPSTSTSSTTPEVAPTSTVQPTTAGAAQRAKTARRKPPSAERFELPDEICTAHLKPPPAKTNADF